MQFLNWFFCLVSFIVAMGCSAQSAVDFSFTDVIGKEHNLFQELDRGNIVVLDFFFVDCKPCQKLTPGMVNLYNEYQSAAKNVVVFGISDRDENAKLKTFDNTYNVTYPTCGIDGGGDTITDMYKGLFNLQGWPTYAVICPDKQVYWNLTRDSSFVEVREKIDTCFRRVNITTFKSQITKQIYPNPATTQITVDVPNTHEYTLNIYSMEGKKVFEQKVIDQPLIQVDISNFSAGTYWVEIFAKEQKNITKLMINKL